VKAALSAMTVKTDRKDARGIAQLMRMGWFHVFVDLSHLNGTGNGASCTTLPARGGIAWTYRMYSRRRPMTRDSLIN
jgi:hypothetical protein